MIEVRYQPGVTPMVFYRGEHNCGSATCLVDSHGELVTELSNHTMTALVDQGYSLEIILPPGIDCWF